MKHLIRFNEHILASDEEGDHIFNQISALSISDLEVGDVYKYKRKIKSGVGRGHTFVANVEFIKVYRKKYYFKIVRSLTPKLGNVLDINLGDTIISTANEVPEHLSIK